MQTLFNGRYKIIKTIGSGGMGTVSLVENVALGTKWALKAIPKNQHTNYDLLAEPNILKKINHPALPRIIDIEEDESNLYIIEDYIEGKPLNKQLEYRKSFDEATVIEWAKQLCNILNYLHKQTPNPIIYRDMKPSNIIVSSDNIVKVIDFGIAREFKKDSGSDTSYMGTRGYAAPEQYGTSQTDARTDIYSLGVTMYHLLTGKSPNEPPYEFRPLRELNSGFSEGIEHIVNKCVQNDPINRYQSVDELLYDLDNIIEFNSIYQKKKAIRKIKITAEAIGVAIAVIFLFVSGGNAVKEKEQRYNSIIEEGYSFLNLYQFEQAQRHFEAALKVDNKEISPYMGLAQILLKQGRYDECTAYLNDVSNKISDCNEDAQFNYLKGSVLYENQEYDSALPLLEKAYRLDNTKNDYQRDLAVCHAKLGNLSEARKILDSIQSDGVTDDILNYVKGQVILAEGDTTGAVKSFENVIKITDSEDLKTRSYMELSNIYKKIRHNDKNNWSALDNQISVLERAVKDLNYEDNLIITEAMAEAYFTAKNYDLAIQKFDRLLELGYDRPYIYRNIAIIYQQMNDFYNAEDYLLQMKEKYPNNYQCYLQLAYLYMDEESRKSENSRDYSEVLNNYNLAVQFAPNGKNTSDIIQLTAKINELKQKGWL